MKTEPEMFHDTNHLRLAGCGGGSDVVPFSLFPPLFYFIVVWLPTPLFLFENPRFQETWHTARVGGQG